VKIEVSNAEIVDRLTILFIKQDSIQDESKLKNIRTEIEELLPICNQILSQDSVEFRSLYNINKALWKIEDEIREKERNQDFDDEFIYLARSVYFTNDQRSKIKRDINEATNSKLIEEKSYEQY